jgi:hypothetical protein
VNLNMKSKVFFALISLFLVFELTNPVAKTESSKWALLNNKYRSIIPEWREFEDYASNQKLQYATKNEFQSQKNSILFQGISMLALSSMLSLKKMSLTSRLNTAKKFLKTKYIVAYVAAYYAKYLLVKLGLIHAAEHPEGKMAKFIKTYIIPTKFGKHIYGI